MPVSQPGATDPPEAICLGELIVDFISLEPGRPLPAAERFQKCLGGAPANVAVGLHHHGVRTALWSKVGADSLGTFALDELRRHGLAADGVSRDARRPTRFALIALGEDGERHLEVHNRDSADQHLTLDEVPAGRLRGCRLFHFGGVPLLGDEVARTTFALLRQARAEGCLISFDPNIRPGRGPRRAVLQERLAEALRYADLLQTSEADWENLWEGATPEDLLQDGPALLILTRGRAGARLLTRRHDVAVPSAPARPVDTTGAGDAFLAAFLAETLRAPASPLADLSDEALRSRGDRAAAWAARILACRGAVTAYGTPTEDAPGREAGDAQAL